jgi:hypothetical protein
LFLDLATNLFLLECALPFELELPSHVRIGGTLGLLLTTLLGASVECHVAGETAGGAAKEHGRGAGTEQQPAGADTGGGAGDGADTGRARSVGLAACEAKRDEPYENRGYFA